jgi:hypothetical protein
LTNSSPRQESLDFMGEVIYACFTVATPPGEIDMKKTHCAGEPIGNALAWNQGYEANRAGYALSDNPYFNDVSANSAWSVGFMEAEKNA